MLVSLRPVLIDILNQFELIYKDPADYVNDYFSNLRNQIDIERERIKLEVDKIALSLIEKINDFEIKCQMNK